MVRANIVLAYCGCGMERGVAAVQCLWVRCSWSGLGGVWLQCSGWGVVAGDWVGCGCCGWGVAAVGGVWLQCGA